MQQSMKQPRGLYVLFFAEAWERFSYYGMRALLVLYMVKHLKYEKADALQTYAMYTGLVYFTPLLGGYLADRILGARKAIIIGGIVMAIGHLAMAVESLLYIALALLIIGNGFFKPNISSIVGGLYTQGDPRRDGGFTIFYMGINIGAFLSPIVCGLLGDKVGWHYGFGAAGIGMIIGLTVFLLGQRLLGTTGFPPSVENPTADTRLTSSDWKDIWAYAFGCVFFSLLAWPILRHDIDTIVKFPLVIVIAAFVYFAISLAEYAHKRGITLTSGKKTKARSLPTKPAAEGSTLSLEDIHRLAVIVILSIFTIVFWAGFEQAGGTFTLFAEKQTDRLIALPAWIVSLFSLEVNKQGQWLMPSPLFQSINPLLIVLLGPLFSILWLRLDQSRFRLHASAKFAIGLLVLGLGFWVMYQGDLLSKSGTGKALLISPLWLVVVYSIHTIAELCLSPVGLSTVTKLSPGRFVSLMMGLWFAASAIANYVAGTLEKTLEAYHVNLYYFLMIFPLVAGVILLLLTPFLKRWSHGRA